MSVTASTGTVAVTVSAPSVGPSVWTVVATPPAPVTPAAGETDPWPAAAAQFTVTPGTGLPYWSRTRTAYGTGSAAPGAAFCLSPAFLDAWVGASGSAVAVNVTLRPLAVTWTDCAPAIGPSVHVALAWPAASVTVAAVTLPPPLCTAHTTGAPTTGLPPSTITVTTRGAGRTRATVSVWASPLVAATLVGTSGVV